LNGSPRHDQLAPQRAIGKTVILRNRALDGMRPCCVPAVRLTFDRGTIVASDLDPGRDLADTAGSMDAQCSLSRPASCYAAIKTR
jgi:hypothetical protein